MFSFSSHAPLLAREPRPVTQGGPPSDRRNILPASTSKQLWTMDTNKRRLINLYKVKKTTRFEHKMITCANHESQTSRILDTMT
ncbi:hypothetical protein NDU88_010517 [Pleurodeles waltl]|uniref:Uncharacterized protein n=1 Tax=Pleurodeles waltl TaxID=8319 RepID=A0AAV7PZ06_PLEWA|nr:hypothetical protein NDU88_010517 [Pleurodeles waltl]